MYQRRRCDDVRVSFALSASLFSSPVVKTVPFAFPVKECGNNDGVLELAISHFHGLL